MFTLTRVLVGLSSVVVLFITMLLIRLLSGVSRTRATGRGAIYGDLNHVLTNPVFWLSAVLIFFAAVLFIGKSHVLGRP